MTAAVLYPSGYGKDELTLEDLQKKYGRFMEPGFARRFWPWLKYQDGVAGVGSAIRGVSDISAASAAGHSFHQKQQFADGSVWFCAVDLVVRSPGNGHTSGGVPWSLVPLQGSEEARRWGLHVNVPGESWHMQPTEIDGWYTWVRQGRPRPLLNWPELPSDTPEPPGMFFDPRHGQFGLWPIKTDKPRLGQRKFVEERREVADGRWQWAGDAVLYLQGVIFHHGGGGIKIDGYYGPETDGRVYDLQRWFKLKRYDGLVGPQTWAVIDFLTTV